MRPPGYNRPDPVTPYGIIRRSPPLWPHLQVSRRLISVSLMTKWPAPNRAINASRSSGTPRPHPCATHTARSVQPSRRRSPSVRLVCTVHPDHPDLATDRYRQDSERIWNASSREMRINCSYADKSTILLQQAPRSALKIWQCQKRSLSPVTKTYDLRRYLPLALI